MCSYYDNDDCRYTYVYYYDQNGKIRIRAQEKRECPIPVHFMGLFYCYNITFFKMIVFYKLFADYHVKLQVL